MKTIRFLWMSLIGILALCIIVFTTITYYMINQNEKAAKEIGSVYLDQLGEQIQLHFESVIDLRVSQFEGLLLKAATATATVDEVDEEVQDEFIESTYDLGFTYLAFYDRKGTYMPVVGQITQIDNPEDFLASVIDGEQRVTDGRGADGSTLLIVGVPVVYTAGTAGLSRNETTDQVMLAGIPIEDISSSMSLDVGDTLAYSHIIHADGTFILDSAGGTESSYLDRIRSEESVDGAPIEDVVDQLGNAMAHGETCSATITAQDGTEGVNFAPLPRTDGWYIATVMVQDLISTPVQNLMNQRFYTALIGCGVIVLVILLVFVQYFRITRRQIAVAEAAQREADAANLAKSRFLPNMSHDIRTPMDVIVGMASIATSEIDSRPTVQNCLAKITLSSRHLLGLVNDVLDISKIESGNLSLKVDLVSLREVADQMIGIIQPQVESRGQSFDVLVDDIVAENVYCDGVRLSQVLLNLLSNAIKFTPEGGAVELTISQTPPTDEEDFVTTRFTVKDTGIGMGAEFQSHIFDSFSREGSEAAAQVEGTGLGMPITKGIVDKMGGTIEIDSAEGEGSTFSVTLDLERAHGKEADMTLPAWSMLVVDEDERVCRSATRTLAELGIQAQWADDVATAVRLVGEHRMQGSDFHIVLVGWQMPDADGIETVRRIREAIDDDTSVLLISAYDWNEIENDARKADIDGFVSKPLFKSTLYHGLRKFDGGSKRAPGTAERASEVVIERNRRASLAGRRVLLAEDQELNWEVVRGLLAPTGVILEWTQNGRECVDRFAMSETGFYDAVLMDVQMPVMDGYEATRGIRALERRDAASVPIIAMTADVFSQDVGRSLQSGMNAHVPKPVNAKTLMRVLAECIGANSDDVRDGAIGSMDDGTDDSAAPAAGSMIGEDAEIAGKEP